jgi:hypothetical protein
MILKIEKDVECCWCVEEGMKSYSLFVLNGDDSRLDPQVEKGQN